MTSQQTEEVMFNATYRERISSTIVLIMIKQPPHGTRDSTYIQFEANDGNAQITYKPNTWLLADLIRLQ